MRTVDPRYHKPDKGDIRTYEDQELSAVFDGRSWRRLCPQCPALARPIYCIRHSSGSKPPSMACECFDALEGELDVKIVHAHWNGSDGEVRIPGTSFRVDGYIPHTNQVFEFLGDYYHANPDLFPAQTIHPFQKVYCHEVYASTMARMDRIRGLGYQVRYIWEKDYKIWKELGGSLLGYFHVYGDSFVSSV
jgi:hypothetical protein